MVQYCYSHFTSYSVVLFQDPAQNSTLHLMFNDIFYFYCGFTFLGTLFVEILWDLGLKWILLERFFVCFCYEKALYIWYLFKLEVFLFVFLWLLFYNQFISGLCVTQIMWFPVLCLGFLLGILGDTFLFRAKVRTAEFPSVGQFSF